MLNPCSFFSASTADVSQVWPGMDQSFTKEVEDEANSYFQRIYNHPPNPTISIDEVLEMLKKFKDSPVKKERVGTRVIVNFALKSWMLTESRFFNIQTWNSSLNIINYKSWQSTPGMPFDYYFVFVTACAV